MLLSDTVTDQRRSHSLCHKSPGLAKLCTGVHKNNGTNLQVHLLFLLMKDPHWLDKLNPPQRQAVTHHRGPLLVLAGAGSGKTRVLTHRIAHLIEVGGVSPDSIVAVTFTNRAADEMRHRVDALIADQGDAAKIIISTFHSLGARLLRSYAPRLDLDWNFSIYDDADQRRLIANLLRRGDQEQGRSEVRQKQSYIDACKNRGQTPEQAQEEAFDQKAEAQAQFYADYQQALYHAGAVDFGDLIMLPLLLFRRDPGFARRLSEQWQYLMVDEFQDTNPAQYELLAHLTSAHDNLAVVGDDDQAIYRWRGADATHILGFEKAFQSTQVVKLEQNYRSTALILDAANDVIAHNDQRHPKQLWTERPRGESIVLFTGSDDREEASFVAESIFDQIRKGAAPQDFAIFYRANAQGRLFEEQLRQWGLNYRIVGGLSFYDRREIKDVLAYLRAALNPYDDIATSRVINTPRRGVGATTLDKLQAALAIDGVEHLQDAAELIDADVPAQSDLFSTGPKDLIQREAFEALRSLRGVSRRGVANFLEVLDATRDDLLHFESLRPVVERLLERIAYAEHIEKDDPDVAEDRLLNIGELISAIEEFESDSATPALLDAVRQAIPDEADDPLTTSEASLRLRAFLDRSALVRQSNDDHPDGAVTLMTIHGSKGLEFDTVYLVGMEEGTFPNLRHGDEPEKLAEERRLAYVAITRAQNRLFITNARRRRVYGQFKDTSPSRFLLDISEEHLHVDPRSTVDGVNFGKHRHRGFSSSSSQRTSSAGQSLYFDQSSDGFDDLSFNQAPPDWDLEVDDTLVDDYADDYEGPADADGDDILGATVSHSRFGVGEVLSISGDGDDALLKIDFVTVGQQTVIRKFLKILG